MLLQPKANCTLSYIKSNAASRGGDLAPLSAGEASPGVLNPGVESSVQETHRPVEVYPEGHKHQPRDGTPLLQGQAERAGAVQHGEKIALR